MESEFPVRIDIKIGNRHWRLGGMAGVSIVKHGFWAIDQETGKKLFLITLRIPKIQIDKNGTTTIDLNFCPTESLSYELVDKYLETEYENDRFKFNQPVMDSCRKPQIGRKANKLALIIEKWRNHIKETQ